MGYKFTDGDVRFLANELGQPLEETRLEVEEFEAWTGQSPGKTWKAWNKDIFGG
tara:strand:- start:301 stop:462 length:162 start_codon:yes stop_codon:yes gene_type:complete